MAQPETMDDLIRSINRIQRASAPKVVGTLATRSWQELGSDQRTVAAQYQNNALSAVMALSQSAPGAEMVMNFQTDHWYREHDVDHIFAAICAYIQRAAVSSR